MNTSPAQTVSRLFVMRVFLTSFPKYKNKWECSLESVTWLVFELLRVTTNDSNVPVRAREFSVLRNVLTGSGAHPVSCAVGAERDGIRAETRFRLSPKRTSPFKSVGASVQSTAGSRGVRVSLSNAG